MQDNLNNIIRAQRLKNDDIRFIIFQIVDALDYLHNTCGVTHRDLKPLDIGINKDMSIKIIDLNVEQPKDADYVLRAPYRAPELLFAWKSATEKVDSWSLGCIMAEFLCGRIIFAGRDRKLIFVLRVSEPILHEEKILNYFKSKFKKKIKKILMGFEKL